MYIRRYMIPYPRNIVSSSDSHPSSSVYRKLIFTSSDIMVKYPWILQKNESAIQEEYTVKYKNIVFDFGNVIGKFDGNFILEQFCSSREDMELLIPVLYRNWLDREAGTVDYEENI